MVRSIQNHNFFLEVAICKGNYSFEVFAIFFQKCKLYDFCMLYVDVRKSCKFGYESHPLSNCVGVKFDVSKLRFVCEMFMWV
jgi:hypothetical protein